MLRLSADEREILAADTAAAHRRKEGESEVLGGKAAVQRLLEELRLKGRLPTAQEMDEAGKWYPKPLTLKLFLIAHGCRPEVGISLADLVDAYMARKAPLLTAEQIMTRAGEIARSRLPCYAMTIVHGGPAQYIAIGRSGLSDANIQLLQNDEQSWTFRNVQLANANPMQVSIMLWVYGVAAHWMLLLIPALITKAVLKFWTYDAVMGLFCSVVAIVIGYAIQHAMCSNKPMALWVLDLQPFILVLVSLLLADTIAVLRSAILGEAGFTNLYHIGICIFHGSWLVFACLAALTNLRVKPGDPGVTAANLRGYFSVAWLQMASTILASLSYNGGAFDTLRGVYYGCGILLPALLWMITPQLPFVWSTRMTRGMYLFSVCASDLPVCITALFVTASALSEGTVQWQQLYVPVDAIFKAIRVCWAAVITLWHHYEPEPTVDEESLPSSKAVDEAFHPDNPFADLTKWHVVVKGDHAVAESMRIKPAKEIKAMQAHLSAAKRRRAEQLIQNMPVWQRALLQDDPAP